MILKVLHVWHTNCLVAYLPTEMTPYFDEVLIRVSMSSIILFLFPSFSLHPELHHPVPAVWKLLVLSLPLISQCFLTSHHPELFPSRGGLNSSICPLVSESPSRRDVCVPWDVNLTFPSAWLLCFPFTIGAFTLEAALFSMPTPLGQNNCLQTSLLELHVDLFNLKRKLFHS